MLCGEAIVWARNERLADVACSDFVAIDRQAKRPVRLCSDMAQGGYWHALLRHELNTDCACVVRSTTRYELDYSVYGHDACPQ